MRRAQGFTLIEVLVVVVIVGVMAGTVALSFTGADRERRLRTEADKLANLLEITRFQAVQRNEEWGVSIRGDGYTFARYEEQSGEWIDWEQRPLKPVTLENIRLEVTVDQQVQLPGVFEESQLPDVVFFSSGESQSFAIRFEPEWESDPWLLESDGFQRVEAERLQLRRR